MIRKSSQFKSYPILVKSVSSRRIPVRHGIFREIPWAVGSIAIIVGYNMVEPSHFAKFLSGNCAWLFSDEVISLSPPNRTKRSRPMAKIPTKSLDKRRPIKRPPCQKKQPK